MKTVLATAVLVYLAFAAFAWLMSDRMMFLPPSSSYRAGQLPIVMVPTDGGSIATLHLPNPSAAITLLYAHGNAEDLGHLAPWLEELRRAGFAVLAFDYRGYGMSTGGPPTAPGATNDMEAVYHHAVNTLRSRRRGWCCTVGRSEADRPRISRRGCRSAGSYSRARS